MTSTEASAVEDEYVRIEIHTCAEFLALNLTLSVLEANPGQWSTTDRDGCGQPFYNITAQRVHPVHYVTKVTYPIFLLICTVGNTLSLILLGRNSRQLQSGKWILVMALAFSDLMYMWAQFFPFITTVATLPPTSGFISFVRAIGGICTFLKEAFITSSDWILVTFSVQRFSGTFFPSCYAGFSRKVSARRGISLALAIGIFVLAAAYAVFKLVDYYYFYYNDDERCPPYLIRPPKYMVKWNALQQAAVVAIQLANYVTIFSLNTSVAVRVFFCRRQECATHSANNRNDCQEAARLLIATALVYSATQFPPFVLKIIALLSQYPLCATSMDDTVYTKFLEANAFLINFNYSINFLLYAFISTPFRKVFRGYVAEKCASWRVRWNGAHMSMQNAESSLDLHDLEDSLPSTTKNMSSRM